MHVEAEVALKEWAVVCAALADGRQSVLLRKGGIRDRRRDFAAEHRAFVLLPTYFHAKDHGREQDLAPEVRPELAARMTDPDPGRLHIGLYAEVTRLWFVDDLPRLRALAGRHVLSDRCVADRFAYRAPGLWVLSLRTHRLDPPAALADRPDYAGCVSWVALDRPVRGAATPVTTDEQHARREADLVDLLGEGAVA